MGWLVIDVGLKMICCCVCLMFGFGIGIVDSRVCVYGCFGLLKILFIFLCLMKLLRYIMVIWLVM